MWGRNNQVIVAVVVEVSEEERALLFVLFTLANILGRRVNTPRILACERPDEIEGEIGARLGSRDDLFDVVGVQIHAEGVDEVVISEENAHIVVKTIRSQQDDFARTGP